MKAKKNVAQQNEPAAPKPPEREFVGSLRLRTNRNRTWETPPSFDALVDFLTEPTMDNAAFAVDEAFNRLIGLSSSMTVKEETGFDQEDWHRIASSISLDASILRHAFDLVFEVLWDVKK